MDLNTFFGTFIACILLYFGNEIDPDRVVNTPQNELAEDYDVIIVGGGTTGCILANRLTENGTVNVLLIEAGGDENSVSDNPLLRRAALNTEHDWNYTTVFQPGFCLAHGGRCPYPRGHVLGGTSAINDLLYVRGHKADYDGWAELGNKDWGFDNILNYFKRLEGYKIPSLTLSPYHGANGPWTVRYPRYRTLLREEYVNAGLESGWIKRDYNGELQNGIDYSQLSLDGATGSSTAQIYLNPIRKRKNLTVIKRSLVSRILLNDKNNRAIGVEYLRYGRRHTMRANLEVILTAGSINTAQLLILSGIGPQDELRRLGIPPKSLLPVGKNFQDHPATEIMFEINQRLTITSDIWRNNQSILAYTKDREGPLTTTGEEANAFLNVFNSEEAPNVELRFFTWVPSAPLNSNQSRSIISVRVVLLHPQCFGSVTLRSNNIKDLPTIDPNYLCDETEYMAMEKGIIKVLDFMRTPTMSKYGPMLYTGYQPECAKKQDNEFIKCIIRHYSFGLSHGVGTARMGPSYDENTVVTYEHLLVRNYENLRVADASIMPFIVRGHTGIAELAVAEKAADIILGIQPQEEPTVEASPPNQVYDDYYPPQHVVVDEHPHHPPPGPPPVGLPGPSLPFPGLQGIEFPSQTSADKLISAMKAIMNYIKNKNRKNEELSFETSEGVPIVTSGY